MQRVKDRFHKPDGTKHGSLQSCIRTNDIELVGDGSHLTYFEMIGNFSFGGGDYESSVEMWHLILSDLDVDVTNIHVHPSRDDHRRMWEKRKYEVVNDESCVWSDGQIGGECCEVFCGDLEIGNLVNPMGISTDVGFGWERLHQVVERKDRVDQTSLFGKYHPIVSDHSRTLEVMRENGIKPGGKGRGYICKRLVRRMLPYLTDEKFIFDDWIDGERKLQRNKLKECRRLWRRHSDKSPEWWWETHGLFPEELPLIK